MACWARQKAYSNCDDYFYVIIRTGFISSTIQYLYIITGASHTPLHEGHLRTHSPAKYLVRVKTELGEAYHKISYS